MAFLMMDNTLKISFLSHLIEQGLKINPLDKSYQVNLFQLYIDVVSKLILILVFACQLDFYHVNMMKLVKY